MPPPTPGNPSPIQHTFFSSASGSSFTVQPDRRGNTLGRGTEIVLNIGEEDMNFLSTTQLKDLVCVHIPRSKHTKSDETARSTRNTRQRFPSTSSSASPAKYPKLLSLTTTIPSTRTKSSRPPMSSRKSGRTSGSDSMTRPLFGCGSSPADLIC